MNKKVSDIVAQFGSQASTLAISLVITPVATRFLDDPKKDLGVWAVLVVVTGFCSIFASGSVGTFAIRSDYLDDQRISAVFLLAVVLGIVTALILALLSVPICRWMRIEEWYTGLVIMAVAFVPTSWQSVACAIMRKEKRFVHIMLIDVVKAILVIGVTTYLLVAGCGLWSYIWVNFAASIFVAVVATSLLGFPRLLPIDRQFFKEGVRFSLGMTGFSSVNYWGRNLDNILIGKFFGTAPLGIYANAYRIMFLPSAATNRAFQNLALPYLAPHQKNTKKLQYLFFSTLQILGLATVPAMTFVWLERDLLVNLYLGTGWDEAADLLAVLMPIGMLHTMLSPLGLCYQISGKTGLLFKIGLFNTTLAIIGFLIGIQYNLYVFVWVYFVVNLILVYPIARFGTGTIHASFADWLAAALPILAIPACSLAAVSLLDTVVLLPLRPFFTGIIVATVSLITIIVSLRPTVAFARKQLITGRYFQGKIPAETD